MEKSKNKTVVVEDARPFLFKGKKGRVVLFIHGFTDSPHSVKSFAQFINKKEGISTYGIRLLGHGTTPSDLECYRVCDWRRQCDVKIQQFARSGVREIDIVGSSLGGLLGLELASKYPNLVKKVICVDTPTRIIVQKLIKYGLPFARPFRYWRKKTYIRFSKEQRKQLREVGIYDRIPMKNIRDLIDFFEKGLTFLPKVKCDLLLIQSGNSIIISKSSAQEIFSKVSSKKKEILVVDSRFHSTKAMIDQTIESTSRFLEKS